MGGSDDKDTSSISSDSAVVSTVSSTTSSTISELSTSSSETGGDGSNLSPSLEQLDEPTYKLNTGEILDVNENGDVLIIKAKISFLLTDKQTISQNYHNAEAIIKSGGDKFKEIQYWAVADMQDGSESKVISFTVPEDVIQGVANQNIVATQLPDLITDLWILPSLQQTTISELQNSDVANSSTQSSETTPEPPQSSTETTPPAETPQSSAVTTSNVSTAEPPKTNIVYIAATGNGTKYHIDPNCSKMNGNVIELTKDEAEAAGYSPCGQKRCYG